MNTDVIIKSSQESDVVHRKTFCRICAAACGLDVEIKDNRITRVRPDKDNVFNWKDFCLKGGSSHHLRDHPKRLTTPMKRVGDKYIPVSYDQAIKEIASQLNSIRKKHGADAIATYIGNPGLGNVTSNMFQGGLVAGIKTTSNYTVGSVDQNNFNLVAEEVYGSEMAVLVPDVDHAKCMMFIGANPVASYLSWMYSIPDGWNRVLAAQKNGADLIMVDPRETAATKKANTHLKITPGEDWALLLAMIKLVFENGWEHKEDCAEATGIDIIREIAANTSLEYLSGRSGISIEQIKDVARRFATAETGVCVAHTGVSQNRNGTIGEWLSHVLNLITGRIDRKGGRFYQPGIFRNTMKVLNKMTPVIKRRSRIGGFKSIAGGFPIATLPDEITTPGEGQVRALIINAGNPVISGPDGARLDKALEKLELLIAVDLFQRESHRHAHWLIPGCHMLERDEFHGIFNCLLDKPFVQLGQAVIEPLNGIKPEWEFFRDLAVEMKVPFMGIPGLNSVIRVSRWVGKVTGNQKLAFNPRWVWAFLVKAFGRIKWKDLVNHPSGYVFMEKSYGAFRPALQTEDKRIHAAPADFVAILKQRLAEPLEQPDNQFPFKLVNQRHLSMMNSFLVEGVKRTEVLGDYVEMNPADAASIHIDDEQMVKVSSKTATITAKAKLTEQVPPGIVSMYHGWGGRLFDPRGGGDAESQGINRNLLVSAQELDELSGTPNLNGTRVSVLPA